ncbi:hypothetical protein chiPu_0011821 [Chiloscyllium punctatum]|uniref:Uncharacterized protein n=1 Tax=Chiloscyllium punctatum TaxID=137246 RepID=A0A401SSL1_CHIPU|nr:hypothetical protein [Chiloscyllium punctatum]
MHWDRSGGEGTGTDPEARALGPIRRRDSEARALGPIQRRGHWDRFRGECTGTDPEARALGPIQRPRLTPQLVLTNGKPN